MEFGKDKNSITRLLKLSFFAIIIFSIFSFTCLGLYMSHKSHEAFHQIGNIYISGMSEKMAKHFESVIQLRFNQVDGLVSVVLPESYDQKTLYEELVYRAKVRNFDYLALCSANGGFVTLYGKPIQPLRPKPFVEALTQGEKRVAIGEDSNGPKVVPMLVILCPMGRKAPA